MLNANHRQARARSCHKTYSPLGFAYFDLVELLYPNQATALRKSYHALSPVPDPKPAEHNHFFACFPPNTRHII